MYSDAPSFLLDQDKIFVVSHSVLPAQVVGTLQHASSLDEISQYHVLPNKLDQLEFIVYDSPRGNPLVDPEVPLAGNSSPLQTIFSVRISGQPNYLGARVPIPTHWDLDLMASLLEDYDYKLVLEFLRFGWPMSRGILPPTNESAKVNHKGAIDFPNTINHCLATEHSNNILIIILGPFFSNPFPD